MTKNSSILDLKRIITYRNVDMLSDEEGFNFKTRMVSIRRLLLNFHISNNWERLIGDTGDIDRPVDRNGDILDPEKIKSDLYKEYHKLIYDAAYKLKDDIESRIIGTSNNSEISSFISTVKTVYADCREDQYKLLEEISIYDVLDDRNQDFKYHIGVDEMRIGDALNLIFERLEDYEKTLHKETSERQVNDINWTPKKYEHKHIVALYHELGIIESLKQKYPKLNNTDIAKLIARLMQIDEYVENKEKGETLINNTRDYISQMSNHKKIDRFFSNKTKEVLKVLRVEYLKE